MNYTLQTELPHTLALFQTKLQLYKALKLQINDYLNIL